MKIDDVRGQAEAKEEITRVITLWQSGEEFEKAGGKRERGLLFLGAPGTGKTMISKAIATNFNCPFVTIPGSGFAGMFIGMDALTVQFLARKARKLARKWGGQCIVFIDEIDAVGMRRQALQGGATGAAAEPSSIHDFCFYGPNGALTPTGDLVIESRGLARAAVRAARRAAHHRLRHASSSGPTSGIQRFYPGFGMGMNGGGQALNQLLVVMDGIDEPPVLRKFITNRLNTFLDAMFVVPRRIGRSRCASPRRGPAQGADLLHRRLQRADRGARPGADPAGTDGAPHLVPHPDQGRPARHLRPLPEQGRPTSPTSTPSAGATSWPGSPTAIRRR